MRTSELGSIPKPLVPLAAEDYGLVVRTQCPIA